MVVLGIPARDAFMHAHRDLSLCLDAAATLLKLAGVETAYAHVSGHSGHPWNELADWLASAKSDHLPAHFAGPQA
eukprot:9471109-Lingulodinium_polyedra.AAC.1